MCGPGVLGASPAAIARRPSAGCSAPDLVAHRPGPPHSFGHGRTLHGGCGSPARGAAARQGCGARGEGRSHTGTGPPTPRKPGRHIGHDLLRTGFLVRALRWSRRRPSRGPVSSHTVPGRRAASVPVAPCTGVAAARARGAAARQGCDAGEKRPAPRPHTGTDPPAPRKPGRHPGHDLCADPVSLGEPGRSPARPQERLTMLPFASMSIRCAAGVAPRPGIVRMSPQIG